MVRNTPRENKLLQAALDYIESGYRVYPIQPKAKLPLFEIAPHGFKSATDNPEQVKTIWANYPTANIGIPTGDRFWVLDLDGAAGIEDFEQLQQRNGSIPMTPAARTGGGGKHIFFAADERIRSRAKIAGTSIDTKGLGGAIVAPPSLHASDNEYAWEVDLKNCQPATAPEWLIDFVTSGSNGNGEFVVEEDLDLVDHPGAGEGERNNLLCRLVGSYLGKQGATPDLLQLAQAWGRRCDPPMHDSQVNRTVVKLIEKHLANGNQLDSKVAESDFEIIPFSDIEPTSVEWLWDQRIALGKLTILSGVPGLGKTFIACDLASHISTGESFPDGSFCPQGDAIIVSCEDGASDTLRPRLDAHGAEVARVHFLTGLKTEDGREYSLDLRQHTQQLDRALSRYPDCRVLILDPISAYMGKTDSNNNADVRGVLGPICGLAEKHRVAVIGVSHLTKREGRAINRTLGSIAFVAAARATWGLVADPEDSERRLLLPVKNNLGFAKGLAFRIIDGRITWEETAVDVSIDEIEQEDGTALKEAKEWLSDFLSDGPVKAAEGKRQAQKDGIASRTLDRAKKALKVNSFRQDRSWWWKLPEEEAGETEETTFTF